MITQRISNLSTQKIIDMKLEDLADICLLSYCEGQGSSISLPDFVRMSTKHLRHDIKATLAINEAFQMLQNNGCIAQNIATLSGEDYFITRAGNRRINELEETDGSLS